MYGRYFAMEDTNAKVKKCIQTLLYQLETEQCKQVVIPFKVPSSSLCYRLLESLLLLLKTLGLEILLV